MVGGGWCLSFMSDANCVRAGNEKQIVRTMLGFSSVLVANLRREVKKYRRGVAAAR